MDKKLIGLDLTHIADGGLQEKLDKELEKVFDNILDLNTDAKAKRKVTITLMAEIEQQAETKSDIIDFNKKKVGN
ncbi:phage protein [Streptococcus pneumoniae]|nr:phage protein [Streptococcus pneumoniae]